MDLYDNDFCCMELYDKHFRRIEVNPGKKKKLELCSYMTMSWIQGTSNVCERLFSRAKLNVGYLRHNMSPMHLEAELFLFVNKKFWDAKTVSQLASNHVDL